MLLEVKVKDLGRNKITETFHVTNIEAIYRKLSLILMDEPFEVIKVGDIHHVVQGSDMVGILEINVIR